MIKKIVILSSLISTLVYADIDETGFILGIEGASVDSKINYANNGDTEDETGGVFTASPYTSQTTVTTPSVTLGYQYYFTRVYLRATTASKYEDEKERYTLQNSLYELNADYLPLFYMSKSRDWNIRGIIGVGVGVNESQLLEFSDKLDKQPPAEDGVIDKDIQYHIEYGYQVGLMSQFSFGLNVELGIRYRTGNMLGFTAEDDSGNITEEVTFLNKNYEYYLGISYLF